MTNNDTPSPSQNTPTELGLHIKRPCLAVADLDRALTVYRDILGFRLDYLSNASPTSYLYSVFQFPRQAQLRFATLSTEYEPRALALTEVKGIELPPAPIPYRAATVIRVPEIAPMIQKIQALGLAIVGSSRFIAPPNLVFMEQAFFDYDDHLMVLYEVKPEG